MTHDSDNQQTDETRINALRAALMKGAVELNRGEGLPYTPQMLGDISDAALKNMHSNQVMDPDVLP